MDSVSCFYAEFDVPRAVLTVPEGCGNIAVDVEAPVTTKGAGDGMGESGEGVKTVNISEFCGFCRFFVGI